MASGTTTRKASASDDQDTDRAPGPTTRDQRRAERSRRGRSRGRSRGGSVLNPGFPKWAVGVLALVVLVGAGFWMVFFSSMFGVRDVTIKGTELVDEQQVEQAVGLGPDDALATVDLKAVADTIESALPPVESAVVTRSWPGTLVVTVTERTPVATVTVDGAPWLIDATGTPYLAVADYPDDPPAVLPLDIDDPGPDDLATTEAVTVIAGLDDSTRELVASVSAPSAGEVTLTLQDGRVVIWGDASRMQDKITMLPAVLDHDGSVYDISSPQAIVIK